MINLSVFLILSKAKNQESLKDFLSLIDLKWIGIILLQSIAGLSCIFLPWYLIAIIFPSFALITFLHIRFKLWAYILVFFIPFLGIKYPGVYLHTTHIKGLSADDSLPLLLVMSVIASSSLILFTLAKLRKDSIKSPLFVPVLLLVCYSLLTLFWSPANMGFNLNYFIYLMINISIYYFLFHIIDNEDLHRRLMWCLVFSGIVISIQTILYYINTVVPNPILVKHNTVKIFDWLRMDTIVKNSITDYQTGYGFFMGPQETYIILNMIILVAMGLLLIEKGKVKLWFLRIIIVMLIISVFFTGKKAGTWSLFIVTFLFLFLSIKFRKKFFRNSLIFFSIILFILLSTYIINRTAKDPRVVNVNTKEKGSIGKRIYFWETGFEELNKRGLTFLGLGIGGYKYCTYPKKIPHAHNVYLSFFFDFGFMGIIIASYIILILARMFLKIVNHQKTYLQNMSLTFGVILILIAIIGLVYIPHYMSILWFLLALASSTFHLAQKELLEKMGVH